MKIENLPKIGIVRNKAPPRWNEADAMKPQSLESDECTFEHICWGFNQLYASFHYKNHRDVTLPDGSYLPMWFNVAAKDLQQRRKNLIYRCIEPNETDEAIAVIAELGPIEQ